jgi:glycosyltransferase involved in cell wall biosynthesis
MEQATNISIVMPLYNKGPYVGRALESVLKQTHSWSELIVVDDGSTDCGAEVVKNLRLGGDKRIRLVSQRNSGPAAARNRGIRESQAGLIAFLDADDEWSPHFLETGVPNFDRYPCVAAVAVAYRVVYPNGTEHALEFCCGVADGSAGVIENYFQALLEGSPPICSSSVIVRREVFDKLGGFPPIRRAQDTAFWSAMALSYPIAFANMVSATFHLDADAANRASMRFLLVNETDANHILAPLDQALATRRLSPAVATSLRRYRQRRLAEMIRQNLMCGDPERARRIFARFGTNGREKLPLEPRVPLYLAATLLPPIIPKTYWNLHHRLWSALKR